MSPHAPPYVCVVSPTFVTHCLSVCCSALSCVCCVFPEHQTVPVLGPVPTTSPTSAPFETLCFTTWT